MSNRRLAAIMFTDIEGYTALMQRSEVEAMGFRAAHRKIFDSLTTKFNGEIIQYYGDGTLSIFDSAVDAVKCGIAMQLAFRKDTQIPVRIGIHSGDIVLTEDDIIGDAVNVASRVESLAVPGSVLISDKLFDEIKNNSDIKTVYLDTFRLKNVKPALGIYAISNDGLVVPPRKAITGKLEKEKSVTKRILAGAAIVLLLVAAWFVQDLLQVTKEQTIVLLPPKNYTGEEDLDYLVEGVHDLLYGDLCKVSDKLRVISPFTARALTNAGKSMSEIAAELDVDYFLETSISCVEGDNLCINPRLVEFDTEERQLWTEEYFEKKGEILNFNHFLVNKIADDINIQLTPDAELALAKSSSVDTAAIDLYLRGEYYLDQFNPMTIAKAGELFKQAIAKDPDWGLPYAGLSLVIAYQMQLGFIPPATGIPKLNEYLALAFELDPNSSRAYLAKAISAGWHEWNWKKAETAFLESLRWDPNDPLCRGFYAHFLMTQRRNDEALKQGQVAERLDPLRPFVLGLNSQVVGQTGDHEAALAKAEKALSIDPDHFLGILSAWGALNAKGDHEGAFKYLTELNSPIWEKYGVADLLEQTFNEHGRIAFLKEYIRFNEEILAKDGLLNNFYQAFNYIDTNNYDKAWESFEQALDRHNPNMPYISTTYHYNKLRGYPEYLALLKRMNLPTE
ncbi:MAG: hypothetical protein KJN70_00515 [Eudoraea sp.]|nr:hypothetical protein [Eudoraea sp.]